MTLYSYHINWKKHVPAKDRLRITGLWMVVMKLK